MNLNEMKLSVCEKLPELIYVKHVHGSFNRGSVVKFYWKPLREINWPTEGLQVCHEAENMLTNTQKQKYGELLQDMSNEAVVGYVPDYLANLR